MSSWPRVPSTRQFLTFLGIWWTGAAMSFIGVPALVEFCIKPFVAQLAWSSSRVHVQLPGSPRTDVPTSSAAVRLMLAPRYRLTWAEDAEFGRQGRPVGTAGEEVPFNGEEEDARRQHGRHGADDQEQDELSTGSKTSGPDHDLPDPLHDRRMDQVQAVGHGPDRHKARGWRGARLQPATPAYGPRRSECRSGRERNGDVDERRAVEEAPRAPGRCRPEKGSPQRPDDRSVRRPRLAVPLGPRNRRETTPPPRSNRRRRAPAPPATGGPRRTRVSRPRK